MNIAYTLMFLCAVILIMGVIDLFQAMTVIHGVIVWVEALVFGASVLNFCLKASNSRG